ncbi:transcription initiation factor TFIID subunit 3-like isoform X1 [Dreissena polymorpha]|nr:transcription initiation factor TFIID subunit 3-like isoform X1 [Dreissena polymorpha]
MSEEYSRAALQICMAQICQHLGWNSIHSTPLELLTDVLERYLLQVAKTTHRYAEQFGRTEPRLEDVFVAFEHMGIQVSELDDYMKHVEPLPFAKEVVSYPVPCENDLKFPHPDSKEVQQRKVFDFVPEHLPYMHPELTEEEEEEVGEVSIPGSPERLKPIEPVGPSAELSPSPASQPGASQGEKRPAPSPGDSPLPFKRPRLTTSQPLPEEACASQYEMKTVVMTTSGILSPLVEGRGPDIKRPPVGIKQNVIIVRQKTTSSMAASVGLPAVRAPGESSIIRLDFNTDPTKKGKIVEVDDHIDVGVQEFDRGDPEYKPAKKKLQLQKRLEKEKKIKRGPGRPKSPGRAGAPNVIHNKGAFGFKIPKIGDKKVPPVVLNSDNPLDLSAKATPPAPNISVVKVIDVKPGESIVPIEYKPVKTISKEQEEDIEDTIDSVICQSKEMAEKESTAESPVREFVAKSEPAAEEWTVTAISETYSGPEDDDDNESDHKEDDVPNTVEPENPTLPPETLAPHLRILQQFNQQQKSPHMPRPRGRPKGSVSGFYKTQGTRGMHSPLGRKPGRPPGVGRSPTGRSPGRPPLSTRSPGRPPLSRSPGRPPFHRSPGRPPASGRSPGRPKGSSGLSPKPRGRPRGSKSPRSRGASPRGGHSPRSSISFDSHEPMDATYTTKNTIGSFKNDNEAEDSGATLFSFPSRSPSREATSKKEPAQSIPDTPRSPSASLDEKSSSRMSSSPAPTEPALSRENTPEVSDHEQEPEPVLHKSPSPKELMIVKKEPASPQKVKEASPKKHDFESRETFISSEKDKHRREKDRSQSLEKERKEHSSQSSEKERKEYRSQSSEKEWKEHRSQSSEKERKEHRHQKEHSHSKERERSKEKKKDKKKKKKKNKDRDRDRDRPREKERDREEKHKEHKEHKSKERADKEAVKEASPSLAPLQIQKLKIKFGSASSPGSFSISQLEPPVAISPKHEPRSPPPPSRATEMAVPKLKFKVLPPKPDGGQTGEGGEPAWTSSIKEEKRETTPKERRETTPKEKRETTPKPDALFASFRNSPKPKPESPLSRHNTSDSDHDLDDDRSSKAGDDGEVTMSVVKGKIMKVKKPDKKSKKKGSSKKGKNKSDVSNLRKELAEEKLFGGDRSEKLSIFKENSPLSPRFSPKNVPSPITIPALKAAPPPPSPPSSLKKSPPKPKAGKEIRPPSPSALYKELMKSTVPPKTSSKKSSSSSGSPKKKSAAVSPTSRKKDNTSPIGNNTSPSTSPIGKTSPSQTPSTARFLDFQAPKTPSPRRPSSSPVSSPMYSPASSPGRDSPLHFQIPPTPALSTRYHSPQPSPPSRQISTDEEVETPPADRPKMPPPSLPPMPPSSAQKRGAQRTVILETVGSFVNESGEKIWICPSCTMQDDGSPMIGCDSCDDWYHWACVGIKVAPEEEESWYCSKCFKPNNKGKASKRGRKKRRS